MFFKMATEERQEARKRVISLMNNPFFGLGLFMISLSPTSVNIQTIVLGNILAITPEDTLQLAIIGAVSLAILFVKWKDLMVVFFDENNVAGPLDGYRARTPRHQSPKRTPMPAMASSVCRPKRRSMSAPTSGACTTASWLSPGGVWMLASGRDRTCVPRK